MKIFNTSGELILETESQDLIYSNLSGADLRSADLRHVDLLGADLRYSDLRGADLRYSDLLGVDLRHANLLGADLLDANLRDADLIVLQMDLWTAYITTNNIRIGCQSHTLIEWENFTDEEILEMHPGALEYWNKNKEVIIALCKRFDNKGE